MHTLCHQLQCIDAAFLCLKRIGTLRGTSSVRVVTAGRPSMLAVQAESVSYLAGGRDSRVAAADFA